MGSFSNGNMLDARGRLGCRHCHLVVSESARPARYRSGLVGGTSDARGRMNLPADFGRPMPGRTGPVAAGHRAGARRVGGTGGYHPPVTLLRPVSGAAARRFMVLRHVLAPPRELPPGAGQRDGRGRPARLAPVRSARGRRPQPRPRPARPGRRLPPGVDRRPPLPGAGALRDVQQGPQPRPDAPSCPTTGWPGIGQPRRHAEGSFDEHAPLVDRAPRPDPGRRASCPRPTSSRARRSTGTGGRRTRSGRSSRRSARPASWASPGGPATGATTTWSSASSRPSSWPSDQR